MTPSKTTIGPGQYSASTAATKSRVPATLFSKSKRCVDYSFKSPGPGEYDKDKRFGDGY